MAASDVLEIHGRLSEVTFADGVFTTCRQLDEAVSSFEGIDSYCLVQIDESNATIEIVRSPGGALPTNALARAVKELTRISRVTIREVDCLRSERGRKFSTIRSYSAGDWRESKPTPRRST
jgi:hypothetical protein